MPFRVQCPHAQCRKYNLVDDHLRGKVVHCLICQGKMPTTESVSTIGQGFIVRQCPHCNSKLKVPADAATRRVKCSQCKEVFGGE